MTAQLIIYQTLCTSQSVKYMYVLNIHQVS